LTAPVLVALLAPAAATVALIAWGLRTPLSRMLVDRPNERSLHDTPRPRIGGIALMLAALPAVAVLGGASLAPAVACAAALAVISAADDLKSLPASVRLAAHAGAAALAAYFLTRDMGWTLPALLLSIVAIAWTTNLYNFMDGADGLAGGMALIGFSALAVAAAMANASGLALACAAIASASAGFLMYNFPPARVFMGDAGSIPLGFLAATLGLAGVVQGAWTPPFPVLVFAPFIVDASLTLLRRVARRERFWRAHRSHLYQRLVLAGWSHRRLALHAYALMALAAGAALGTLAARGGVLLQCGIIAIWVGIWSLLDFALGHRGAARS
jgi:UDP-N-acetylmuramyl pentapeptide phosphotransferase/UDP-N-acetylglucosamine-1-phosphate transferase